MGECTPNIPARQRSTYAYHETKKGRPDCIRNLSSYQVLRNGKSGNQKMLYLKKVIDESRNIVLQIGQ